MIDLKGFIDGNSDLKNKLKAEFEGMKGLPIHKSLAQASQMALPFVMMLKMSGVAEKISAATQEITPALKELDHDDLQGLSNELKKAKREKIQSSIEESTASNTNYEKAVKNFEDQKEFMTDIPEEAHIATSQALSDIMPESLQTVLALLSGHASIASTKKAIRANRKKLQNTPVKQLAAEKILSAAAIPTAEMTDMIYNMLQKVTPEALEIFIQHITDNLSTEDYDNVANGALNFVEELGKASAAGQFWQVANPDNVTSFAQSLKKVMHTIDNAMEEAGITSDGALAKMQTTFENRKKEMMGVFTVKTPKARGRTPKR